MPRVVQSARVRKDMYSIGLSISAGNPTAAQKWLDDMNQLFHVLSRQPHMGEEIHTRRLGRVRRFSKGNYVVYFRPVKDGVHIARVYHGARDHEKLI